MRHSYDENLYLIQRMEERKIRTILPSKRDYEVQIQQEIAKKPTGFITITAQRAQLDTSLINTLCLQLCMFHYYEIPLQNRRKPLIINFSFVDQTKMKFYISRNTITPNRFNFEEAFQRKQVLKYTEGGEEQKFSETAGFLYMAVFAQQATTIHVKLQYGVKVLKPPQREAEEFRERPQTASYFSRSQMLKRNSQMGKDLVSQNMNTKQYEPECQKRTLQIRRVQSAKRFTETLKKKQQIDAEKLEIVRVKYEYQQKKKIISEIMQVRSKIDEDIKVQQEGWFQVLYLLYTTKLVRTLYCKRALELMHEANIKRRKNRTRANLRKYLEQYGTTINKRTVFHSVLCLQILINVTSIRKRSKKVITSFMLSYGQIGEIIQKTYRFRRLLRAVLDSYRGYKKRVSAYVQRIVMLWSRQWGVMYNQIQKDDIEKVKEIKKQMSKTIVNLQIDEEVKKSPYLDPKLQWSIAQNFYLELRHNFLLRLAELRKGHGNSTAKAYNIMVATQGFDKKQVNLFAVVNKEVIRSLCYRYMLEKRMIQSALLKKN